MHFIFEVHIKPGYTAEQYAAAWVAASRLIQSAVRACIARSATPVRCWQSQLGIRKRVATRWKRMRILGFETSLRARLSLSTSG